MDIGRAFNYVFQDPNWVKKILFGAVMVIIPIFGWLVLGGYLMRTIRLVATGTDTPLPEWNDIGGLFTQGLSALGIGIIWAIPSIFFSILANVSDSFALNCLSFFVSIINNALIASAIVPVAISGNFADGLQVEKVVSRVVSNIGDYAIVAVMGVVLGFVAAVGAIACGIGILATIAYAAVVNSHLWAQAFRRAENLGAVAPGPRF